MQKQSARITAYAICMNDTRQLAVIYDVLSMCVCCWGTMSTMARIYAVASWACHLGCNMRSIALGSYARVSQAPTQQRHSSVPSLTCLGSPQPRKVSLLSMLRNSVLRRRPQPLHLPHHVLLLVGRVSSESADVTLRFLPHNPNINQKPPSAQPATGHLVLHHSRPLHLRLRHRLCLLSALQKKPSPP